MAITLLFLLSVLLSAMAQKKLSSIEGIEVKIDEIAGRIEDLQRKAEIWSRYELYITSWLDQITSVERKLDIIMESQKRLLNANSKMDGILAKVNDIENELKMQYTKHPSKSQDDFQMVLNRIETRLVNYHRIGNCFSGLNCIEMLEDIAAKVDIIVDRIGEPDADGGVTTTLAPLEQCEHAAIEEEITALMTQMRNGEKWYIMQKRNAAADTMPVNFNRSWSDYKNGFHDANAANYWLGNEPLARISLLCASRLKLRIELEDFAGHSAWAEYGHFHVAGEDDDYQLDVSGYRGNASDSLADRHSGAAFSTYDRNHDPTAPTCCPCALTYGAGWWFRSCFSANLNGVAHRDQSAMDYYNGIIWEGWLGNYSLARTIMMFTIADP